MQNDFFEDLPEWTPGERNALDAYFTPRWCTLAAFDHLRERLGGVVWEPCAGDGHISDLLREHPCVDQVIATDIDRRAAATGVSAPLDFLRADPGPFVVDWIVSNPPYRTEAGAVASDFVRRAIETARVGVAMLLRLSFLEPCSDRADLLMTLQGVTEGAASLTGVVPTDLVVLPRVHFIGAPDANNGASVWFVWDRRARPRSTCRAGRMAELRVYPADIKRPTYQWPQWAA